MITTDESQFSISMPISDPEPRISVVIPSLPRNTVQPTSYLANQTVEEFEVLVVEDHNDENLICDARNVGIRAAAGDLIALTDDDCMPPPGWLDAALDAFSSNDDLVLIEGPVDKHPKEAPRHYVGANLAFRKEAALAVGGFDQAFAGWGDDKDFGWRIEDRFGVQCCEYLPGWEMRHDGPMRSEFDARLEAKLRRRHHKRYFSALREPQSKLGRAALWTTAASYRLSPTLGELMVQINPKLSP